MLLSSLSIIFPPFPSFRLLTTYFLTFQTVLFIEKQSTTHCLLKNIFKILVNLKKKNTIIVEILIIFEYSLMAIILM